jgi:hypothetical protein
MQRKCSHFSWVKGEENTVKREKSSCPFKTVEIEMLTAGYRVSELICQWLMLNDILLNNAVEKITYSSP